MYGVKSVQSYMIYNSLIHIVGNAVSDTEVNQQIAA